MQTSPVRPELAPLRLPSVTELLAAPQPAAAGQCPLAPEGPPLRPMADDSSSLPATERVDGQRGQTDAVPCSGFRTSATDKGAYHALSRPPLVFTTVLGSLCPARSALASETQTPTAGPCPRKLTTSSISAFPSSDARPQPSCLLPHVAQLGTTVLQTYTPYTSPWSIYAGFGPPPVPFGAGASSAWSPGLIDRPSATDASSTTGRLGATCTFLLSSVATRHLPSATAGRRLTDATTLPFVCNNDSPLNWAQPTARPRSRPPSILTRARRRRPSSGRSHPSRPRCTLPSPPGHPRRRGRRRASCRRWHPCQTAEPEPNQASSYCRAQTAASLRWLRCRRHPFSA